MQSRLTTPPMPNDHPLVRINLRCLRLGSSSSQLILQACFVAGALLLTGCSCGKKAGSPAGSAAAVPGDFDGNGVPDLLWQNASNGQVRVDLYKRGAEYAVQGSAVLNTGNPNWRLVGSADFDANGTPDLIWQDNTSRQVTVHYYTGGAKPVNEGWKYLNAAGNPGWHVVAAADFDANGTPDLVWQHAATREVTVNYYGGDKGSVMEKTWAVLNPGNKGWRVVATADVDRNGTPDLIWQDETTRGVTVNYYGGARGAIVQGWKWMNIDGLKGWTVVGVNDFDANKTPDLVLSNDTTHQVNVHFYGGEGGAVLQRWAMLNANGNPGWDAVVPR